MDKHKEAFLQALAGGELFPLVDLQGGEYMAVVRPATSLKQNAYVNLRFVDVLALQDAKVAPKWSWWFGYNTANGELVRNRDTGLLAEHHPELLDPVVQACRQIDVDALREKCEAWREGVVPIGRARRVPMVSQEGAA